MVLITWVLWIVMRLIETWQVGEKVLVASVLVPPLPPLTSLLALYLPAPHVVSGTTLANTLVFWIIWRVVLLLVQKRNLPEESVLV